MNSYPDPTHTTVEPLPFGEPEYREYPSAPPQPRGPVYPPGPAFPPGYRPVAGGPMPPVRPIQQVPYGAPPYPYPYAPNGQVFRPATPPIPYSPLAKKGARGWIIVLSIVGAGILILASVLIFAFSRVSSNPNTPTSLSGTTTTTSNPGVVNLGQPITIDGLTATILSATPLAEDGATNPDPGNKYVVVNVSLQNNTSASQYYTPDDFHVFNGDNQERDVEVIVPDTYTAGQQLSEGSLDAYGSATGDLIIQVPVNDHNVKLGWSPGTVSSDSEYEWNLGL